MPRVVPAGNAGVQHGVSEHEPGQVRSRGGRV